MNAFKTVSKEEFFDWIANYPRSEFLSAGTTTICEPPIRHYLDHSLPSKGELGSADYFFDKEVARVVLDWLGPNGETSSGDEFYEYKIKEEQ